MRTPLTTIKKELIESALFVVSHSGGKDSQAMYIRLQELGISDDRIIVVHAELPGVDWAGSEEHIQETVSHRLEFTRAKKTFRDMVLNRAMSRPDAPSFPSPQYRQCTSDLKRDPINRVIRQLVQETGIQTVVNCMGIRAQESPNRSRMNPFKLNKRVSKAGRTVYDWMPIFEMSEEEVFETIAQAGQKPFWTYAEGMTRKSCMFCIMASSADIRTAARLAPGHFADMVALEQQVGSTMFQGKTLEEVAGLELPGCSATCAA